MRLRRGLLLPTTLLLTFASAAGPVVASPSPSPDASPGEPEHIAGAALFLASDDATFVTGEALVVDGGGVAG